MAEEYNQQGRDLYGLDKYSEAMDWYRKAEEADPSCVRTYMNMSELYIMTKQLDKAKEVLNKALYLERTTVRPISTWGISLTWKAITRRPPAF